MARHHLITTNPNPCSVLWPISIGACNVGMALFGYLPIYIPMKKGK